MARFRDYFADRVVLANLALRLVLVALAIFGDHWHGGDSNHYLDQAAGVLHGEWGGDPNRTPGYYWFLALLAPHGVLAGSRTGPALALALLAQTLIVWAAGSLVYHRKRRAVALAWLFEPAMLVYSELVMSDALFGVGVLVASWLATRRLAAEPRPREAFVWGLALGACTLVRSLGTLLIGVSVVWGFVVWGARTKSWGRAMIATLAVAIGASAVLAPRVYWLGTRYHRWVVASQGDGWLSEVAGIVEYSGQGLDFIAANQKWLADPDEGVSRERALKAIAAKFPTFLALSAKGVARLLVGHANVEWTQLLTGVSPIGPGWTKVPEHRSQPGSPSVEGVWLIPWTLGVLLTALFCLWVYSQMAVAVWQAGAFRLSGGAATVSAVATWAIVVGLGLAAAPLVYGDARFRCGVWPVVIALWAYAESTRRSRSVSAT